MVGAGCSNPFRNDPVALGAVSHHEVDNRPAAGSNFLELQVRCPNPENGHGRQSDHRNGRTTQIGPVCRPQIVQEHALAPDLDGAMQPGNFRIVDLDISAPAFTSYRGERFCDLEFRSLRKSKHNAKPYTLGTRQFRVYAFHESI
jgi:hypothetical protein